MSNSDGNDYAGFSMLDLFRQEVEQHSARSSDGLLAVEQGRATAENLESLMRAAHSIKGAARIVQLDPVVTVAHAMEDCFLAAQEGRLDHGTGSRRHSAEGCGYDRHRCRTGRRGTCRTARRVPPPQLESSRRFPRSGAAGARVRTRNRRPNARGPRSIVAPPPSPAPGGEMPAAATPPATEGGPVTTADDTSQPGTDAITRVVRVTAENLDRLMGLAGESSSRPVGCTRSPTPCCG